MISFSEPGSDVFKDAWVLREVSSEVFVTHRKLNILMHITLLKSTLTRYYVPKNGIVTNINFLHHIPIIGCCCPNAEDISVKPINKMTKPPKIATISMVYETYGPLNHDARSI